jgi:hypothetical protein
MTYHFTNPSPTIARMRRFLCLCTAPALALLLIPQHAPAEDDDHCSNATLKGEYASYISGVRTLFGLTENFVGISLRNYDGKGNLTEEWASFHGALSGVQGGTAQPGSPLSGTYTVNPDCTGSSTLTSPDIPNAPPIPPILSDFVIMDHAREVREIVTSPLTNVVSADFKRVR